jgi:hypothetical protein
VPLDSTINNTYEEKLSQFYLVSVQYEHPSLFSFQRQEEDKKEKERRQKEQLRLNNAQTRGEAKKKVNRIPRLIRA